jgi:hypothetical protein
MIIIARVDAAFEVCERHLDASGGRGSEIEAILTSYVSAIIYSALEARAREIVATRGAGDGTDDHLGNFTRVAATRLMRSIKIGDLAGIAGWFHPECKDDFQRRLDPQYQAAWDTIIANRHTVAHEGDERTTHAVSNLTFSELKALYPLALEVLECLSTSISQDRLKVVTPTPPSTQPQV